jgi:hypothetical protein
MRWIKRLFGRTTDKRLYGPKSQCGKILLALLDGEMVGGKEACKLVGHNGLRRLNQVRARLRARGIAANTYFLPTKDGKRFKLTWLSESERRRARELMGAG